MSTGRALPISNSVASIAAFFCERGSLVFETSSENSPIDPCLATGCGGVLLFLCAHYRSTGDLAVKPAINSAFQAMLLELKRRRLPPGLFKGIAGIGWVLEECGDVLADIGVYENRGVSPIDQALERWLRQRDWERNCELVYGLAGIAIYFLKRDNDLARMVTLPRIVELIASGVQKGGVGGAWPALAGKDEPTETYFSIGHAHGVTGIISVLSRLHRYEVNRSITSRLIRDGLEWLLSKELASTRSLFPARVGGGLEPRPSEIAWCYGDLCVVMVLLDAYASLGERWMLDEATRILLAARTRVVDSVRADHIGLCHGYSGALLMLDRARDYIADSRIDSMRQSLWTKLNHYRCLSTGDTPFRLPENDRVAHRPTGRTNGLLLGLSGIGLALSTIDGTANRSSFAPLLLD